MIIKIIKEDIFAAFMTHEFDILIQGNNCFHVQGGGVAGILSTLYPEVLIADKTTPYGDESKLGTYSIADTVDGKVINAYTQYNFGRNKRHVDYVAVANVFRKINDDFKGQGLVFATPPIGCGLAGGEWYIVEKLINDNTPDINIIHYYI